MRIALVAALAVSPLARAGHPFLTEDPGTQGAGHFELELGLAARRGDPTFSFFPGSVAFSPQLSIGVTDNLDLIGQAVWLDGTGQGPAVVGSGDSILDIKWRFYEREGLQLAVRAGLDLPTGDSGTNLGAGELGGHVIGIVGVTFGAFAVYANAVYAYTRAPGARANLGGFSIALTRTNDEPLHGFIEVATYSNPDPANPQWPAVARTGFIYSVTEWMDVDAGFQTRLNRSATRAVWLAGATVHW